VTKLAGRESNTPDCPSASLGLSTFDALAVQPAVNGEPIAPLLGPVVRNFSQAIPKLAANAAARSAGLCITG